MAATQLKQAVEELASKGEPIYCAACARDLVNPHQSNAQRRRAGYKKGYHVGHRAALEEVLEDIESLRSQGCYLPEATANCRYMDPDELTAKIKARLEQA